MIAYIIFQRLKKIQTQSDMLSKLKATGCKVGIFNLTIVFISNKTCASLVSLKKITTSSKK